MQSNTSILHTAALQGGVLRRDQAIEAGFTKDQIDWRVSNGHWELITNGGYRLLELPGRLHLAKAAMTILPDATVSHYSAAAIHDLASVSRRIVSVTVASKTTHAFPGVRVFRNDDLAAWHRSEISGLPTTTLERTVVDLAALLSERHMEFIVDDLLAAGRFGTKELTSVLDSVARRGKPGVGCMRAILEKRSSSDDDQSPLEKAGNALLVKAGFTGFEREYPIPWSALQRFDTAFPFNRLAIEWDSRSWHTLKLAFQNDRERDRLAMEHGWRVLRFTWKDVHDNPSSVAESLRTVLRMEQPV